MVSGSRRSASSTGTSIRSSPISMPASRGSPAACGAPPSPRTRSKGLASTQSREPCEAFAWSSAEKWSVNTGAPVSSVTFIIHGLPFQTVWPSCLIISPAALIAWAAGLADAVELYALGVANVLTVDHVKEVARHMALPALEAGAHNVSQGPTPDFIVGHAGQSARSGFVAFTYVIRPRKPALSSP